MSLGYAEKLSYRKDIGAVGMSEIFDPHDILENKIAELAAMIKESKHLVVFTGAGISTSCGIPDFRGPKGVWTLQHEGKGTPEASLPFHRAIPSMTHMALVALEKTGILKFVISQNVDSLHLRSGIPREKLAELHGNSFREICPSCRLEYLRDFEVESIGMKKTPRICSDVKCGARLRDTIVDWENELPASELKPAQRHCRKADVLLCLGTSLQIAPACNLPLKALRNGGKIVIVNRQVIAGVMHYLNLGIPPYVRVDLFQISLTHCSRPSELEKKYVKWALRVESVHGTKAPLPFIKSVEVSFLGRPYLKRAVLRKQPFRLKREMLKTRPFVLLIELDFIEGCGCQSASIEFPVNLQVEADSISHDKDIVIENLIQSQCCGQISIVERKNLLDPKKEVTVFAAATNVIWYGGLPVSCRYTLGTNGKLVRMQNENIGCSGMPFKKMKCT